MPIFIPTEKQNIQIAEFDPDEILSQATENTNVVNFKIGTLDYPVNLGSTRYQVFAANRKCVCCGIVGNRMFLDPDIQNNGWHFNLYAETHDATASGQTYMRLMTKHHIVSIENCGVDELSNCQTLCFSCNSVVGRGLSIEQIQNVMFEVYRIYKGSYVLNSVKEKTRVARRVAESSLIGIDRINIALSNNLIKDVPKALAKIIELKQKADFVNANVEKIELQSQTTGIIPGTIDSNGVATFAGNDWIYGV